MEKKGLDCAGVLNYSWETDMTLDFLKQTSNPEIQNNYKVIQDNSLYSFKSKFTGKTSYILTGNEVGINCKEDSQEFHLLSIGVGPEKIKRKRFLEESIEDIIKAGGMPILDHPYADPEHSFRDVKSGSKKEKEAIRLLRLYKENLPVEWNGYSVPLVRHGLFFLGYGDNNKKLENLASRMRAEGIPVNIIPTTDIHLRTKDSVNDMGTAFIAIKNTLLDTSSSDSFIKSIYASVRNGEYKDNRDYVSPIHFTFNWGIPKVLGMYTRGYKKSD
jgi:hypothetical protein